MRSRSTTNPPEDEMTSRLRMAAAVALTTVAALVSASPALAIDNGVPDGTNHPNVGLLALEPDGIKEPLCSGFYAGPHKTDPSIGVFVTAAHCIARLAEFGLSGSDLTVTFEPETTTDVDGDIVGDDRRDLASRVRVRHVPRRRLRRRPARGPGRRGDRGAVPEGAPARRPRRARRAAADDRVRQRRLRAHPDLQGRAAPARAAHGADVLHLEVRRADEDPPPPARRTRTPAMAAPATATPARPSCGTTRTPPSPSCPGAATGSAAR